MASLVYEPLPIISGLPSPVTAIGVVDALRVCIACEDGSLRVFASRDDPLTAARPSFTQVELVPRFTRDRKPAKGLVAVLKWRALFSLSDGGLAVHDINGLGGGGFSFPGSVGCRSFCVSPDAGILCIMHAASAVVFAWAGEDVCGPPTAASFSRVAEHSLAIDASAAAASIVRASFIGSATLCLAIVHAVGKDPALLLDSQRQNNERAPFVDLADIFSPFGGRGSTNVSSVATVFSDRNGSGGNGGGGDGGIGGASGDGAIASDANCPHLDLESPVPAAAATVLTIFPSSASSRELFAPTLAVPPQGAHDAGARLSFIVCHAWAGTILSVLSAGLAPALDATGGLCINAQLLAGTPCADAVGSAATAAVGGAALLASVGVAIETFRRLPFWGTIGVVEGGGALLSTALPTAGDASTASLAFSIDTFGRVQSSANGGGGAEGSCADIDNDTVDADSRAVDVSDMTPESDLRSSLHLLLRERSAPASTGTGGAPLILLESHPIGLASSPLFPYVISAHDSGLHVHSARTGALLQSVRVPGGIALAAAVSSRNGEAYFFASAAGVVLLRSLPAVVQAAALLSARPPHYEEALALCGNAGVVVGEDSSAAVDVEDVVAELDASAQGLAALARKVQSIRRHYGYALWSLGDFAAGLTQLSLACEPVASVFALFPTLQPVGPFASPSTTLSSSASVPSAVAAALRSSNVEGKHLPPPELIDALLPPALAPLVHFLASERERKGGTAAVDARLLEALLWLRNHWFTRAGSLLVRDVEGSRVASATADRYAGSARALLACAKALDVAAVTALVHAYAAVLGIAGAAYADADLVSMWRGRKYFSEGARVLARSADEAQSVGDSIGFPRTLVNGASSLASRAPITARVSSLFSFVTSHGHDDPSLLRAYVVPGLSGAYGTEGVLLSLATVTALTELTSGAGCGPTLSVDDLFELLVEVHELVTPGNGASVLAQPEFWLLSGVRSMQLERISSRSNSPVREHLPPLHQLWHNFLGDDESKNHHAAACKDDAARLGPPKYGWTRHLMIALLESAVLSAAARGGLAGVRATDALASAYVSVLRDVGAKEIRYADESGLAREFRQRLTHLLMGAESLDAVAVLAALWAVSPAPSFSDERVILFERLGRHDDALAIIVRDIYDFDVAEAYCARVDAREPAAQVFSTLLRVSSGAEISKVDTATAVAPPTEIYDDDDDGARLLRTRDRARYFAPFLVGSALSRLSDADTATAIARAAIVHVRSHAAQSAADALVLLPVSTPLAAIAPLLEAVSRASCDAIAGAAAARAVAGVTRARVLAEAVTSETRGIQIDKASACAVCKRRVGAMQPSTTGGLSLRPLPFLVFPNGLVCHLKCQPKDASGGQGVQAAARM